MATFGHGFHQMNASERNIFLEIQGQKSEHKKPKSKKVGTSLASYSTKPCVDPKTSLACHNWAKNFIKFHLTFLTISFIIWMSHWRHTMIVDAEFWIGCHQLKPYLFAHANPISAIISWIISYTISFQIISYKIERWL